MTKNSAIIFATITLSLIIVLLILIPSQNQKTPKSTNISTNAVQAPLSMHFRTNEMLLGYFQSSGYLWPISNSNTIPNTLIRSMPADIGAIKDTKTRKTVFIRVMLPIILEEQKRIRSARQMLKLALQSHTSNTKLHDKLHALFSDYKINKKLSFTEKSRALLKRYDELPLTLILAQAAIESGWGTSRFARVGNSLFGEWTYNKNEGIVPQGREKGKTHSIKAFNSLRGSIASYIKNINRNKAYKELRQLRTEMRQNKQPLDSRKLAQGLQRYSQKGQAYVVSILSILNSKEFKSLESLNLDTPSRL